MGVREAIGLLTGSASDRRLRELGVLQAAHLLVMGGLQPNLQAACEAAQRALDAGEAAERFARMVALQGGPKDVLRQAGLAPAPCSHGLGLSPCHPLPRPRHHAV